MVRCNVFPNQYVNYVNVNVNLRSKLRHWILCQINKKKKQS